jgi:hypothetical protein
VNANRVNMNVKRLNTLSVVIVALLLSGCNSFGNRAPSKNAPVFVRPPDKQTEKTNENSPNNARAVQVDNSFYAVPETKDFVIVRAADLDVLKNNKNSDAPNVNAVSPNNEKVNAIEVNNVGKSDALAVSTHLQQPFANSSQQVFASDLQEQNVGESKPSAFVTFLRYMMTVAVVFGFVFLVGKFFLFRKGNENTVKFPEKKN